jgi:hypothetical protein
VKVTQVSVTKLVSFRTEYGNVSASITADLDPGEDEGAVIGFLLDRIGCQLQEKIAQHYKFFWDAVRANEQRIEDARAKAYKACDLLADAAKTVSGVGQQMSDDNGAPF